MTDIFTFLTQRAEKRKIGSDSAQWRPRIDRVLFPALAHAITANALEVQFTNGYMTHIETPATVSTPCSCSH